MTPPLMIATFIKYYGHQAWMNPTYPTTDNIIPVRQFVSLFGMIPHVQAYERLSTTHSHFHALAMVNSTDRNVVQRISDLEYRTAFGGTK